MEFCTPLIFDPRFVGIREMRILKAYDVELFSLESVQKSSPFLFTSEAANIQRRNVKSSPMWVSHFKELKEVVEISYNYRYFLQHWLTVHQDA